MRCGSWPCSPIEIVLTSPLVGALWMSRGPSAHHLIAVPRSAPKVRVQPPFEASAIGRHQEAADKEHHRGENVAFVRQAQPGWILQGLVHYAEKIRQPDDGDEGYVLEQIDDRIDDAGQRDPEGLRQDH